MLIVLLSRSFSNCLRTAGTAGRRARNNVGQQSNCRLQELGLQAFQYLLVDSELFSMLGARLVFCSGSLLDHQQVMPLLDFRTAKRKSNVEVVSSGLGQRRGEKERERERATHPHTHTQAKLIRSPGHKVNQRQPAQVCSCPPRARLCLSRETGGGSTHSSPSYTVLSNFRPLCLQQIA